MLSQKTKRTVRRNFAVNGATLASVDGELPRGRAVSLGASEQLVHQQDADQWARQMELLKVNSKCFETVQEKKFLVEVESCTDKAEFMVDRSKAAFIASSILDALDNAIDTFAGRDSTDVLTNLHIALNLCAARCAIVLIRGSHNPSEKRMMGDGDLSELVNEWVEKVLMSLFFVLLDSSGCAEKKVIQEKMTHIILGLVKAYASVLRPESKKSHSSHAEHYLFDELQSIISSIMKNMISSKIELYMSQLRAELNKADKNLGNIKQLKEQINALGKSSAGDETGDERKCVENARDVLTEMVRSSCLDDAKTLRAKKTKKKTETAELAAAVGLFAVKLEPHSVERGLDGVPGSEPRVVVESAGAALP